MATGGEVPTRAGRHITQPTGYRAFVPAPLPPQPALALGGELQDLLAGEAAETVRRILQLREQHHAAITAQLGRVAGNGRRVLESLFDHPIVAVNDVQKMTGTTYAAANSLVSRLVKLDVLSEMTGYAPNRRFRYAPYIALFSDAGPAGEAAVSTARVREEI